jgi:rare lipoprotein A
MRFQSQIQEWTKQPGNKPDKEQMVIRNHGKLEQNKAGKQLRLLFVAAAFSAFLAGPAVARDLTPEISSKVWVENDTEVATVSINGKDVVTFRARANANTASEEAEDLAMHLQDLVSDKDFDPGQLLPGQQGDKALIKLAGNTALSFRTLESDSDKKASGAMDYSLKLVNALRSEYSEAVLPANFSEKNTATATASFSGAASWYGPQFHGRLTSDGHRFDMEKMTAAHKTLPFGTKLLVMNRRTGDRCVVEVNDRGPFIGDRVLDLSRGAARKLNMLGSGVAMVDCLIIDGGN